MTMASIVWIIIFGAVFYLLMKSGGGCCGGHQHGENDGNDSHDGAGGRERDSEHHGMKIERTTEMTEKDPVCGMQIHDHSITGRHWGQTFHFCSERCRKIFALNPNKYAGA